MATFQQIQDAIELGWAYYVEQIEAIRLKQEDGCFTCGTGELTCLSSAILALEYDVETQTNTDLTTSTYNLLLSLLSNFTGSFSADPTVQIPGITIEGTAGSTVISQTAIVFPGDTVTTYTFPELIGKEVLTVYRGTGTTLRAWSNAPTNEYVQFSTFTGLLTFLNAFSDGESLWVEYKTT